MYKLLALFAASSAFAMTATAADTYTVDPDFSVAQFEIERLGFASQTGRFKRTSGKITLDLPARKGSVEFTIHTTSLEMGPAVWSAHLSDEGLLNVKKYPTMNFKSDKLIFDGDKVVAAEGQFTMLGVTKPIKLTVSHFSCGVSPIDKRQLCSGNISAHLKRSEFGLTKYIPAVSDEVNISVPVDAYKN